MNKRVSDAIQFKNISVFQIVFKPINKFENKKQALFNSFITSNNMYKKVV